ncbi:hypothetical protein [Pontixanthobacter sp. CEM42]|uniref:hypothetical protein n=1 Tax=Pontixanthobacter sp. CEM42 TaxID=2792077 RepID=UPI001AE06AB7|nr:hypothetical protein [Pontixanthobacter sp. CEM42]
MGRLATLAAIVASAGVVVRMAPVDRSAGEIAEALQKLLEGRWLHVEWAGFITQPISDAALESIRTRAVAIELPLTDDGRFTIQELLNELERLDGADK